MNNEIPPPLHPLDRISPLHPLDNIISLDSLRTQGLTIISIVIEGVQVAQNVFRATASTTNTTAYAAYGSLGKVACHHVRLGHYVD